MDMEMALPMPSQLDQLYQLDMQEDLKLALMLGDQLPLVPIPLSPFYLALSQPMPLFPVPPPLGEESILAGIK